MQTNDVLFQLIPALSGPAGVAVAIAIVKIYLKDTHEKLQTIDTVAKSISNLAKDLEFMKEKQIEIKIELQRLNSLREEHILLKAETKAQWRQLDELRTTLKEFSQ